MATLFVLSSGNQLSRRLWFMKYDLVIVNNAGDDSAGVQRKLEPIGHRLIRNLWLADKAN